MRKLFLNGNGLEGVAPAGGVRGVVAQWRWPLAVLALALLLRLIWAAVVPVGPISDSSAYDVFARNLAKGDGYGWGPGEPTAFWAVGTAFMYSLVYRAFDPEMWGYGPVVAVNIVVGLVTVGLGMALARRWFGAGAAIATGLLLAAWPMHVQFSTVIASEQVFTALCLGGVLAWPASQRGLDPRRLLLAAVIFAAATYVRPTALLVPAVLAGAAVLRERVLWVHIARAACAGILILALVSPWTVRNYRAFGEVVLVSSNSGANLWMGNNPRTAGEYMVLPERPPTMSEPAFDKALGREARAYILREPGRFVVRTLVKAVRLHERETIGIRWNAGLQQVMTERQVQVLKIAGQVYWLAVLAAALCGAIVLFRRCGLEALWHPALAVWLYFTAVHAVIVIQDRYHYPVTPFIGSLAAVALVSAWRRQGSQEPAMQPSVEVPA